MFGAALLLILGAPAHAYELLNEDAMGGFDNVRVDLGGFMQPRFLRSPDDTQRDIPGELGFAVARSRLELRAYMTGPLSIDPKVSIELMPEARLVDAYLNLSTAEVAQLRFGQFKAPTNRSFLVSDRNTLFPERAVITDLIPRREMGAMFHGEIGDRHVEYQIGGFNGEGTNRLSNVNRELLWRRAGSPSAPWAAPGSTTGRATCARTGG